VELKTVTDAKSQSQRTLSQLPGGFQAAIFAGIEQHGRYQAAIAASNTIAASGLRMAQQAHRLEKLQKLSRPVPSCVPAAVLLLHLACFQRVDGVCQKSDNSKEISSLSVISLDISTGGVTI